MAGKSAADKAAAEMLASIMASVGIKQDIPTEAILDADEILKDTPQRVSFRGQAVLTSLAYPEAERITRICKAEDCGRYYTTNYAPVAYCSNECMQLEMKARYGISWIPDVYARKERWEVRAEPEMIPMQALIAMKMIVARVESDLGHPIEIPELAFSQLPPGLLRPREMKSSSASQSDEAFLPPQEDDLLSDTQTIPVQEEPKKGEEVDLLSLLFAD